MSAEQILPAFADFPDSGELELREVLALQSLVMGDVRREAQQLGRKVRRSQNPRTYAYAVLKNSGDDTCNGETDHIFSVRMRKLGGYGCWAWSLGISFLACEQTPESRLENHRTLYQFRWNEDRARGRKLITQALARDKFYEVEPQGLTVLPGTESVHQTERMPVTREELDTVANMALDVVYATTPRLHQHMNRIISEKIDHANLAVTCA